LFSSLWVSDSVTSSPHRSLFPYFSYTAKKKKAQFDL
jgi:hypothetical protein